MGNFQKKCKVSNKKCGGRTLSDFFGKAGCQLAAGFGLSAVDQAGKVSPAFILRTMKQERFHGHAERFRHYVEGYDLKAGKIRIS